MTKWQNADYQYIISAKMSYDTLSWSIDTLSAAYMKKKLLLCTVKSKKT